MKENVKMNNPNLSNYKLLLLSDISFDVLVRSTDSLKQQQKQVLNSNNKREIAEADSIVR